MRFRFVEEHRGSFSTDRLCQVMNVNCYDKTTALRRENSPLDCFLILLTFFKTIKAELIWRRSWETRRQAETAFGHSFGPM